MLPPPLCGTVATDLHGPTTGAPPSNQLAGKTALVTHLFEPVVVAVVSAAAAVVVAVAAAVVFAAAAAVVCS